MLTCQLRGLAGGKGSLKPAQRSRHPGVHSYWAGAAGGGGNGGLKPARGLGTQVHMLTGLVEGILRKKGWPQTSQRFRHPGMHTRPAEGVQRWEGQSQTTQRSRGPGAHTYQAGGGGPEGDKGGPKPIIVWVSRSAYLLGQQWPEILILSAIDP